jgi:hypothetical protein
MVQYGLDANGVGPTGRSIDIITSLHFADEDHHDYDVCFDDVWWLACGLQYSS